MRADLSNKLTRQRLKLGFHARSQRASYRTLLSLRPRSYSPLNRSTTLLIDGFPRSGNTFFTCVVARANPLEPIAHHHHAAAAFARAKRLEVPAVLLVREPVDSVVSFARFSPELRLDDALEMWIRYHQLWLGTSWGTVATFPQITGHSASVIRELNLTFSTTFTLPDESPEERDTVFRLIEERNRARLGGLDETSVARPSSERSSDSVAAKETVRALPRYGEAQRLYGLLQASTGDST